MAVAVACFDHRAGAGVGWAHAGRDASKGKDRLAHILGKISVGFVKARQHVSAVVLALG